jgi:hypothetical protein
MYCKACGQRIPDDSAFCNYCGVPQRTVVGVTSMPPSTQSRITPFAADTFRLKEAVRKGQQGMDHKYPNSTLKIYPNRIELQYDGKTAKSVHIKNMNSATRNSERSFWTTQLKYFECIVHYSVDGWWSNLHLRVENEKERDDICEIIRSMI